jgi:hypothetical protein
MRGFGMKAQSALIFGPFIAAPTWLFWLAGRF